jgi:hypothetical protein
VGERADRLAHGVTGDAELRDEFGLGRDPASDRPLAGRDLRSELRDHLVDERCALRRRQR